MTDAIVHDAGTPAPGTARHDARCPRCGSAFHCGAADPVPCPCTTVAVSPAQRAALRERYIGCLCMRCLALLGTPSAPSAPAR